MPKGLIPEVPITLDRQRILRLGVNAFSAFEDAMGVTLPYLLMEIANESNGDPAKAAKVFGFRHVRAMLWAALLHEERTLTLEQAGDLIDQAEGDTAIEKMAYVQGLVMQAFVNTQGPDDKKKGKR